MNSRALARKHLDLRFQHWRQRPSDCRPRHGWLRAIRDALGMSARQAAARLGVAQSTYSRYEHSEAEDTVTLATLRKAAAALDCTLVYALVPDRTLEHIVRDRARLVAAQSLARVSHTMHLEDQRMDIRDLALESELRVDDLLRRDYRRLWEEHD